MTELVDDHYWLGRAKQMVEGALDQRVSVAERLMTTAAWLATLVAGGVTSLVALREPDLESWMILLLATNLVAVIAAYVAALMAAQPRYRAFDPRAPDDIMAAHASMVTSVQRSLRAAVFLLAMAAGLSSAVLIVIASAPGAGSGSGP